MPGPEHDTARPHVVVVGAYDTKSGPLELLRRELIDRGCDVHRVDFGLQEHLVPDGTGPEEVAALASTTPAEARALGRGPGLEAMARGVRARLVQLLDAGRLDVVVFLGGSGAGTVFAAAAPALPFGVDKVLVSTVVAGDTRPYLQGQDALLFHPVVDIEGDNALLRDVVRRAAAAVSGLGGAAVQDRRAKADAPSQAAPVRTVAVTMFGITTPCVAAVRRLLEARGAAVVAFHANGTGGATMERLVEEGRIDAVIDVTTTELADLVAGGTLSAGEERLTAAARRGVPQVIVPGALDTVNFGPGTTVPERLRGRRFHAHNPHVTLMRSDPDENARLGALLAQRANLAPATTAVVLPLGGVSELDRPDAPFWWPQADATLREALRRDLDPAVRFVESPHHVNDEAFAQLLVSTLESVTSPPSTGPEVRR
jgi:uncharacterized protein (UPF0261 family)